MAPVMGHAEAAISLLPDNAAGRAVASLIEDHLTISIAALGASVIDREPDSTYRGLGASAQSERSPLHERPVVSFADGTRLIVDSAAFVRAVCELPRKLIVADGAHGNRRRVSTTVGYMFEAHITSVLGQLDRCEVIDGEAIDAEAEIAARTRAGRRPSRHCC